MRQIALSLRVDDAEPLLRKAARDAAYYGGWVDHLTRRTGDLPCDYRIFDQERKEWHKQYLAAKRIVEAFGVEIEITSEAETLTVAYPYIGGKVKNLAGFAVRTGSKPDYDNPYPCYRRGIHHEACDHAADRVVRKWKRTLA